MARQRAASAADLDVAREVIYAVGLKVLPDFQEFRATLLDHVVLRRLEDLDGERRAVPSAALISYQPAGTPRLQRKDVLGALHRLRSRALVTMPAAADEAFLLTGLGASHLAREGSPFLKDFEEVCSALFADVELDGRPWAKAFARLLCSLFAALGHEYVSVLTTRRKLGDVMTPAALRTFAESARHGLPAVDPARLAEKAEEFLRDSGPASTGVKWVLAQGHFALKVLGMGESAEALASAVLKDKTLYLDTNVLFAALAWGCRTSMLSSCYRRSVRARAQRYALRAPLLTSSPGVYEGRSMMPGTLPTGFPRSSLAVCLMLSMACFGRDARRTHGFSSMPSSPS